MHRSCLTLCEVSLQGKRKLCGSFKTQDNNLQHSVSCYQIPSFVIKILLSFFFKHTPDVRFFLTSVIGCGLVIEQHKVQNTVKK